MNQLINRGSSSRPSPAHALAALAIASLISISATPAIATSSQSHVQASQELAVLTSSHEAYVSADASSQKVELVAARRPITGTQTTLPVISRALDVHGDRWLDVMLPGRPNGSSGWIAEAGTSEAVTGWSIVVDLARRNVSAYLAGRRAKSFQAVVGKPSTPTPTGRFFVEEDLRMPASEAGGPFALALSARSDVFQEFEGGPGQIAIHGRTGLQGAPGSASSHGCVRLRTADIDWLVKHAAPGTPVTIDAD